MSQNILRILAAIALGVIVIGIAYLAFLSLSHYSAQAADIPDDKKDASTAAGKPEEKIKALLQEMVDNAKEELGSRMREFEAGRGTTEFLCDSSVRLLNAERELSNKTADQLAALEGHWQRMKKVEALNKKWRDQGRTPNKIYAMSKYYRLQAEVWLERAKEKK